MRFTQLCMFLISCVLSINAYAFGSKIMDITDVISKNKFSAYKNVAEFIDDAPKVTTIVETEPKDVAKYGKGVVKSITGSDCNRDGVMDNNATCNAIYLKLWLKYKR